VFDDDLADAFENFGHTLKPLEVLGTTADEEIRPP
jgi:hypothetical protein